MRSHNRIYRMTANLYHQAFPKQAEEVVWVIEDTTEEATKKLKTEFPGILVSGISPIFSCIISTDDISYNTSVYMVDMVLKHGSEITIHVLADGFSDVVDMCVERYTVIGRMEIRPLDGTVLPEY